MINELQALKNEAKAMDNEKKAAEIAKEIEALEQERERNQMAHEAAMAKLEQALLEALEDLRVAKRDIELAAADLTPNEKAALVAAAGAWYVTIEALADQQLKIMEAQQKVDYLTDLKVRFADKTWDETSLEYVNAVTKWENEIAAAKAIIAEVEEEIANAPTEYGQIDEWAAVLKAYSDEIEALEIAMAQAEEAYAQNDVKAAAGIADYNAAIAAWIAENPKPGTVNGVEEEAYEAKVAEIEELVAEIEEDKANEPTADNYEIPEEFKNEKIEAPELKIDYNNKTFRYFESLLWDYTSDHDGTAKIYLPVVNGEMKLNAVLAEKEFILGVDGEIGQTWTNEANYKYGLKGALSVIERYMVHQKADEVDYEGLAKEAEENWQNDRATLAAVYKEFKATKDIDKALKKYQPYADSAVVVEAIKKEAKDKVDAAKADVNAAKEAWTKAQADAEAAQKPLIDAYNTMRAALESINGKDELAKTDITKLMNSFVAFAAARENMGIYTYDATKEKHNLDYFRFKIGYELDNETPIMDSVKFSALNTQKKYAVDTEVAVLEVAEQLLGKTVSDAIDAGNTANLGGDAAWFYGVYAVNSWAKATDLMLYPEKPAAERMSFVKDATKAQETASKNADNKYETAVAEQKAAEEVCEAKMGTANAQYVAVYNRYWGVNEYPGIQNEIDPECYDVKSFIEPYSIVNFVDGKLDYSTALHVVLNSMDPNPRIKEEDGTFYFNSDFDRDDNKDSRSWIFGQDFASDFYTYMMWYDKKDTIDEDALEVIRAWVAEVEKAFDEADAEAFEAAKEAYDAMLAEKEEQLAALNEELAEMEETMAGFEANEAAKEDYDKAFKAFVGTHEEDGEEVLNYPNPKAALIGQTTDLEKLVGIDMIGNCTGEWNTDMIGGQLLENAKTFFPEYPAGVKAYKDAEIANRDMYMPLVNRRAAAEKAYVAAAKAIEFDTFEVEAGATIAEYIANFEAAREEYIKGLEADIDLQKDIIAETSKKIANFQSGVPAIDLEIAEATVELEKAKMRYAAIQQAHDYAKANYEKVFGYIKDQDFSFIDFTNIFPDNPNIEKILEIVKKMMGATE